MEPTLDDGWANFGGGYKNVAYRLNTADKLVQFRGTATAGTITGTPFNIGVTPDATVGPISTWNTTGNFGSWEIQTDGDVEVFGGSTGQPFSFYGVYSYGD